MNQRKGFVKESKLVWRISASDPMGRWVDTGAPPPPAPPKIAQPEVSYGSWVTSSYDLLDGTDVVENTDTVPGDLLDELFAQRMDAPKQAGN